MDSVEVETAKELIGEWKGKLCDILKEVKMLPTVQYTKPNGDTVTRNLENFLPNIVHHNTRTLIKNGYSEDRDAKSNIELIELDLKESLINEVIGILNQFPEEEDFLFTDEFKESIQNNRFLEDVSIVTKRFLNSLIRDYILELLDSVGSFIEDFDIYCPYKPGKYITLNEIFQYFENYLDLIEAKIGNIAVKYNRMFYQKPDVLEKISVITNDELIEMEKMFVDSPQCSEDKAQ